ALVTIWLAVLQNALWIAWAGAALELPVTLWFIWNYIDWTNDFYIVTNQRLVYLEKIAFIYDSRQESPLASIMSINVQTADSIQRQAGMGDVVVRTYSGPITLRSVAHPNVLAAAIEEHWGRTRVREKEGVREANRRLLRDRLENGPPRVKPSKPPPPKTQPKGKPLLVSLAEFFSFRVRFEEGDSVTYRKHWYLLLRDIWKPVLGMLIVLVLLIVIAAGALPESLPRLPIAGLLVIGFLSLAGWWLYEFIDWKNDIYMVTADQIFDINKKPLGAEVKKSAPFTSVNSLRYERPGLLGVMLNFGNVVATVPGAEFRFDGVFDPVGVQNDVYRRIEAQKAKKQAGEDARLREEMVNWLEDYHNERERLVGGARQPRPAAAPPANGTPPPAAAP
ncbi:MAG: PH domain-containing protein, partial [Anaerolineales bacterium]